MISKYILKIVLKFFCIFPKNLINVAVLQYDYLHLHASMEHKKSFIIKAESLNVKYPLGRLTSYRTSDYSIYRKYMVK